MLLPGNLVSRICAYEDGEMDHDEVVELFGDLLSTGIILSLQGSYWRTFNALVESGDIVLTDGGDHINGDIVLADGGDHINGEEL